MLSNPNASFGRTRIATYIDPKVPIGPIVSNLHFDGANDSTTFKDQTGKVWTPNGNSKISTAQYKFGSSSGLFDGSSDYIQTPNNDDFNLATFDFTMDFWVYPVSLTAGNYNVFYSKRTNGADIINLVVASFGTSVRALGSSGAGSWNIFGGNYWEFGTISNGGWYHIYIGRKANYFYGAVNGIVSSYNSTATIGTSVSSVQLGSETDGLGYNGYMDEFRLIKGYCLWTSNFAVPQSPY